MLTVKLEDDEGTSYYAGVSKVSFVGGVATFSQVTAAGVAVLSPDKGCLTVYTDSGYQLDQRTVKAKETAA